MMKFNDYRDHTLSLETEVAFRAGQLGVQQDDLAAIWKLLAPLETKREPGCFHRDHSMRVGLLASTIASFSLPYPHTESLRRERSLFFAGLLHDVGKALVPACTLAATTQWTDEDQLAMEQHVFDGFRLLRDRFDFTAHVIVWHHRFQNRSYPKELPAPLQPFSEETLQLAESYGQILMLADVYDAMHRVNSASGGKFLSTEEIREKMEKLHPEIFGDLVPRLYKAKVLR
ncbi:MAG TPA: HD domain-containing protein [Vicinamibacterales bacterium]|nr:HD domain-containing protein [Vicinamibacterales bacterium]